jgi:GH25 family lysozyme M1 (1,4-beta-N-acetylmuramidase)
MSYSFSSISSVSDCDTLLQKAGKIKNNLEFRVMTDKKWLKSNIKDVSEIDGDILTSNLELQAMQNAFALATEGKDRNNFTRNINRLENQLRALAYKRERFGASSYLMKQTDQDIVEKQILDVTALIQGLETRKQELLAA